jgi:hypothetical protein
MIIKRIEGAIANRVEGPWPVDEPGVDQGKASAPTFSLVVGGGDQVYDTPETMMFPLGSSVQSLFA